MPVKPEEQISPPPEPARRGRPPTISRQQVLTAALRIVDEEGLERLTMRRLGSALGVDPMVVYRHFSDKAALFDGLVEYVLSEIELPSPTRSWQQDMRAAAHAARTTFLAHPNAIALLGSRPPVTPEAFTVFEVLTGVLLGAGLTEQQAADGVDCAARTVIGHTLTEAALPPGGGVSGGEVDHVEAQHDLPADRYPNLAAVERAGVRHDPDRLFDLALDGLVLLLEQQRSVEDRPTHDPRLVVGRAGRDSTAAPAETPSE